MGSAQGSVKTAAKRLGIPLEEYIAHLTANEKWCRACQDWHPATDFAIDRSRGDGRVTLCREAANSQRRADYEPSPGPTPGRRFVPARDGDKVQARRRVNYLVDIGLLPNPNGLPCNGCGHKGDDRRHEYHHHEGYTPDSHEKVVALCTTCHHEEDLNHG